MKMKSDEDFCKFLYCLKFVFSQRLQSTVLCRFGILVVIQIRERQLDSREHSKKLIEKNNTIQKKI